MKGERRKSVLAPSSDRHSSEELKRGAKELEEWLELGRALDDAERSTAELVRRSRDECERLLPTIGPEVHRLIGDLLEAFRCRDEIYDGRLERYMLWMNRSPECQAEVIRRARAPHIETTSATAAHRRKAAERRECLERLVTDDYARREPAKVTAPKAQVSVRTIYTIRKELRDAGRLPSRRRSR